MSAFSRSGVTGSCVTVPGRCRASSIAEAMTAPTGLAPPSPAPFRPRGLSGLGASSDTRIEISCTVPERKKCLWDWPRFSASCYVGPYYEKGMGPDSPVLGYIVWQPDELIARFPASAMIPDPQAQALHHATRWAHRKLSDKLAHAGGSDD